MTFMAPMPGLFKVAVGFAKFLFLMILAHKGLDYADICDVFLNGGVEPVDFGLHSGETGNPILVMINIATSSTGMLTRNIMDSLGSSAMDITSAPISCRERAAPFSAPC